MALAQEDIWQVQQFIAQAINERPEINNANFRYDFDLRERTIRVEEELKHQRELMLEGFKQMEKRFELMQVESNKRFEQVDKRFEQMQAETSKRFEQMQAETSKRFDQQHLDIMGLHSEIKQLMRWGIGSLLAVGSLIVAALRFIS